MCRSRHQWWLGSGGRRVRGIDRARHHRRGHESGPRERVRCRGRYRRRWWVGRWGGLGKEIAPPILFGSGQRWGRLICGRGLLLLCGRRNGRVRGRMSDDRVNGRRSSGRRGPTWTRWRRRRADCRCGRWDRGRWLDPRLFVLNKFQGDRNGGWRDDDPHRRVGQRHPKEGRGVDDHRTSDQQGQTQSDPSRDRKTADVVGRIGLERRPWSPTGQELAYAAWSHAGENPAGLTIRSFFASPAMMARSSSSRTRC